MYSKWFSKEVTIEKSIPVGPELRLDNDLISDFLVQQGYRDVSITDSRIGAVRGHKIWNLFTIGDPRRNYHSILVSIAPGLISVRTQVNSWFGLGTQHDKAVFVAEIDILKHFLQTGKLDYSLLEEAQARQRKSDLITFLILIGVGVLFGIAVVIVLIKTGILR